MTLEELITDLKAAGANENTLRLAMNCYEIGMKTALHTAADDLQEMFNSDTTDSIAVWLRGRA